MRKIKNINSLVIIAVFLASISLKAQEEIKGFGKLELGDPVSSIYKLGPKKLVPISTSFSYFKNIYDKRTGNEIFELLPDVTYEDPIIGSSYDPRVRIFHIPKCSFSKKLAVEEVRLKFFEGKLINIRVNRANEELQDKLTEEYGSPEIQLIDKRNNVEVYEGNGDHLEEKEGQKITYYWETNNNYHCRHVSSTYDAGKGGMKKRSYVYLANDEYNVDIRNTENKVINEIKEDRKKAKKRQRLILKHKEENK